METLVESPPRSRFWATHWERLKVRFKHWADGWVMMYRLGKIMQSPLWEVSRQAVNSIAKHVELREAAAVEPVISFCPRCGQIPDGDRRFEEARSRAIEILGKTPKRSDLDFALAYWYWRLKNAA